MLRPCSVDGHVDGMLTLTTVGPGSSIVDFAVFESVRWFFANHKKSSDEPSMEVNFMAMEKTSLKNKHFRNHKKMQ